MKKPLLLTVAAAFLLIAAPCFAASEVPPSFADLVEKLTPAVVNVSTTQKMKGSAPGAQMFEMPEGGEMPEEFRDFFEQYSKQQGKHGKKEKEVEHEVFSLGSGFIIDADGYVVTNNHVIADAEEINVTLSDDTKLKAKIIGRDAKTDLALLKVEAGKKLPFVVLGDSNSARVGDWVIAIGNPFGLGGTVTAGIVSARARNINAGPFDDFIQTDAAINRGNSGGPLFNSKGEVIGINTAIFSPTGGSIGIGFAVPSTLAKSVLDQLRKTGHIDRGWLGVKIQTVTDEIADSVGLAKPMGALVMEITKDSPASKSGVAIGDIITHFDGKEIKEMRNLPLIVADTKIGRTVEMQVWRKGENKTLHVTLGELKEQDETVDKPVGADDENAQSVIKGKDLLGMTLATIGEQARQKYGLAAELKGVVVTKLKSGSEAQKRGISEGDVITQMGETTIADTKALSDAVAAARKAGRKFVLLHVQHGADAVFVTLPIDEKKADYKKPEEKKNDDKQNGEDQ